MKIFILELIKIYQKTFSPDHGFIFSGGFVKCRFFPSCSEYSYEAVERYGVFAGAKRSLLRVLRCNPFSSGGVDLLK